MVFFRGGNTISILLHKWSAESISGSSSSPTYSVHLLVSLLLSLLLFVLSLSPLILDFFISHLHFYLFPSLSLSLFLSVSLLVAVSAFVPSSSPLNPATAESHFIPPPVYLPSMPVYISLAHCLPLSSTLSVCQFLLFPLCKSHLFPSLLYLSHVSLSPFSIVYLTLSLLKPGGTVA